MSVRNAVYDRKVNQGKRLCIAVLCVCVVLLQRTVHSSPQGLKPLKHDHEHETEEHRGFEKQVLLGDETGDTGYDELPREGKVKVLRGIAKTIDINHNGQISPEELDKWVRKNHMKYLLKNGVEYVVDVDLNNDSKMSFKEYELSHYKIEENPGMPENYRNTTRYKHAKRRFQYADVDKDGELSVLEFIYFLNPEEGKHMRDVLVLETIENMDIDGDGALNIKDYIGEGILDMKDGEEFVAKVKEFKSFDKNLDGLLVADEVKEWMFPANHSTSRHEVEHIFSYGDKDKDGQLSYEEFSAIPEHLEQSRVTSYGDMFRENREEL